MATGRVATNARPNAEPARDEPILAVEDLRTYFHTRDGVVRAVDGVSFQLGRGETLSIVGESGCGKSVTAMSILRLLPQPPAKIESGTILFEGENLLDYSLDHMRNVRGNEISMIFQEPMTSLNPVLTVGRQISESLILHQGLSRRAALERAVEMLDLVRIPDPKRRVSEYPHQMSGGMRQRVMIAMALSCNPKVLIADEPTTALDVTIQAQILALMSELKDRLGTAIIIITHDLGVVAEMAERVVVMYAGRKVEEAEVTTLFAEPLHPYTLGLMGSIPRLNEAAQQEGKRPRLQEIQGTVPALIAPIPGCAFAPRCAFAIERCHSQAPVLEQKTSGHFVACWQADKVEAMRHG
jgi:peptide/nickel transport system ATP-binding protein